MAAPSQHPIDSGIERRCLDLMFGQTRTAYLSNAICVLLLWIAFWDNASHMWLLTWTVAVALLMMAREVQANRYLARAGQPINQRRWTLWLDGSLAVNGCLWGLACGALALVATPYQLPILLLIVGGLQTGSVLSSSYLLRAFACFSVPLLLMPLAAFLVLGFRGQPSLFVTAALLAVWSMFILMCARRFGEHYRHSVAVALDNQTLAETLQARNSENERLNRSLQERVDELNATQQQLLQEKARSDGLVERLRALSTTDGLTGLSNRRHFDELLRSEWRRASRNGQSVALLLADVDHFKAYNDRYGHQRGDQCLVEVARLLAGAARREGDWAARYGGEEFALIYSNTSIEVATANAEDLRAQLRNRAIPHDDSPTAPHLTLSVGVAAAIPDGETGSDDLVATADEALYSAKRAGRDRIRALFGRRSGSHRRQSS